MKLRIGLLTSTFPRNPGDAGYGRFLLEAIAELQAAGQVVQVLTQKPRDREGVGEFPFPVHRFEWSAGPRGRIAELIGSSLRDGVRVASLLFRGTEAVSRISRQEKLDVLLCASAIPAALLARLARALPADRRGPPYVVWAQGSELPQLRDSPFGRALLRWVLIGAGARFANGIALADEIGGIARADCEFLPAFRALPTAPPGGTRRESRGPRRFLFVGRLDPAKGIDLLVEAVRGLPGDYSLVVAGDGPLGASLKASAAAAPGGRFVWKGRLTEAELAREYADADCLVIPSRQESLPVEFGEAARAGLPILATDVGDMGRLLREHGAGRVIATANVSAVRNALRGFLVEPMVPDPAGARHLAEQLSLMRAFPSLLRALETTARSGQADPPAVG